MHFAGHTGMDRRKQWDHDRKYQRPVYQAGYRAQPPVCSSPVLEHESIEQGHEPADEKVENESDDVRPPAVLGEDRAQHERETESGEAELLSGRHDGRENSGRDEPPEKDAVDVEVSAKHLDGELHRLDG